MPAKKIRTKPLARQLTQTSVCTQTEKNFNYETMILDYKNQIDVLNKRITDYEATVLQLQAENTILKQQTNKLSKSTINSLANNDLQMVIKEKSISPLDIGNKSMKGCICKGTCANKICGCAKKGIFCKKKLCKCNHAQCRNQFQEVEKENATEQNELPHDGQKTLEKLGRLTLNQEILHASEKKKKILFTNCKNMVNAEKYSVSPLSFGTRRQLFTQDSVNTVELSVPESNSHSIDGGECKSDKPEIQFPHTPVAKRTRSLKNKDEQLKIVLNTDEILSQSSSDNINNKDEIFLPKIAKVIHSPRDTRDTNKLIPVLSDDYIVRRKYRNNKVSEDMASTSLNKEIDEKINAQDLNSSGRLQYSPKPSDKHEVLENHIKNSLLPVSDSIDISNVLDVSLNPMVPKRQLPRSPISAAGNIILPNESKRFSPPKKELAVEEVNWEQHKSELVMCKICKRKFFPHRIDRHVVSCKGI